jgi:hypothetical protein
MSTKQRTDPFAKLETAVGRCVDLRDKRDAALKTAAAALTRLEAMVASDTATQAEINATEVEYEDQVDAFVELAKTLSAACDSAVVESRLSVLTALEPQGMPKV